MGWQYKRIIHYDSDCFWIINAACLNNTDDSDKWNLRKCVLQEINC